MTIEIRELVIRVSVPDGNAGLQLDLLLAQLRRDIVEQCVEKTQELLDRTAQR
ncbi:DUF5908 family protein [Glaciimonas sp. PAMC28666]|uniref:DUF5908 family protein n=1 Tax=Glaciimonas sp. PAMC28666 TaxID=2807626 RepID=UPI00351CA082